MNKKADESTQISGYNIITMVFVASFALLFLVKVVLPLINMVFSGGQEARAESQLDNLIKNIYLDIEDIKKTPQTYQISINEETYDTIVVRNCDETDNEGRCDRDQPKTRLCLRSKGGKDVCSDNNLDFAFDDDSYEIDGKKLIISWQHNKLSLSSS